MFCGIFWNLPYTHFWPQRQRIPDHKWTGLFCCCPVLGICRQPISALTCCFAKHLRQFVFLHFCLSTEENWANPGESKPIIWGEQDRDRREGFVSWQESCWPLVTTGVTCVLSPHTSHRCLVVISSLTNLTTGYYNFVIIIISMN